MGKEGHFWHQPQSQASLIHDALRRRRARASEQSQRTACWCGPGCPGYSLARSVARSVPPRSMIDSGRGLIPPSFFFIQPLPYRRIPGGSGRGGVADEWSTSPIRRRDKLTPSPHLIRQPSLETSPPPLHPPTHPLMKNNHFTSHFPFLLLYQLHPTDPLHPQTPNSSCKPHFGTELRPGNEAPGGTMQCWFTTKRGHSKPCFRCATPWRGLTDDGEMEINLRRVTRWSPDQHRPVHIYCAWCV